MLKKVMIHICSRRGDISNDMFEYMFGENEEAEDTSPLPDDEDEGEEDAPLEISMEGKLYVTGGEVRLSYTETEMTGMEGAKTTVHFRESEPGLITMMRSGPVNTALIFEEKSRHICAYQTPFMPFELCVHTLKVENRLLSEGKLYLDYVIEFRGAKAEHNLFELTVFDAPDRPKNILF